MLVHYIQTADYIKKFHFGHTVNTKIAQGIDMSRVQIQFLLPEALGLLCEIPEAILGVHPIAPVVQLLSLWLVENAPSAPHSSDRRDTGRYAVPVDVVEHTGEVPP